ncbi:MAG: TonB-dependent receptor [Lentimicrobium sp.]|jgi:TonB-linked SusC/RagA family outer membrane protein|nr:TonB-dependent receptor [Lentimicrobium sp.]
MNKMLLKLLPICIWMILFSGSLSAQNTITITGQVVDEANEPLIGVSVVADGRGTITDLDGNFTMTIPAGAKEIRVSYVGYKTVRLLVGSKVNFRVVLENDVVMLQEVVAVGYGTQRKENLTGAIENVNVKSLEGRALTNASMALQGQVAGVMVIQQSGQAGEDQAQIRIRGISSMENNNIPLVIIDGMEGDINDVDPQDIESMTVMKDASSAAIYGNKAASGVILITTKRGKGETFQVDFSYMTSLQQPTRIPNVIGAKDYLKLWNEANVNNGEAERWNLESEYLAYDEGRKVSINWYDVYFKTAAMDKYNLNLMLSSGNLTTNTSFNILDQQGMLYGTGYNRFNYRSNIGATSKDKKIKLDIHLSGYRESIEDNTSESRWVMNRINSSPPFAPYVSDDSDPNDLHSYISKMTPDGVVYSGYAGFIGYKDQGGGKNTIKNRVNNNYVLTYEPIKGLNFEARYGFYFLSTGVSRFIPVTLMQSDINEAAGGTISSNRAELTEQRTETFFQNFQAIGKWDKNINEENKLNLLLGLSMEDQSNSAISTTVNGFVTNVAILDFGENPQNPLGTKTQRRSLSFFGRANYNYKERYLVEGNLRYDGSSRFLKGNRWGVFPSASAAWRVSEEEFFKPVKGTVSNFKFRTSYGLLGNENIYTNYAGYNQLKSDQNYSFEGQVYNALRLLSFADKNTTWEKTSQLNFGADFTFFNKLNTSIDYFFKNTKDILARVQVTHLVGADVLPYQNIGEMSNEGWEFSTTYNDKIGKKFRYSIGANISGVKNELLKLNNTSQDYVFNAVGSDMFDGYNMIITKVGQPYGSYFGYQVERIFQVDDFTWQNNSDATIPHGQRQYELKPGFASQSEGPRPGDLMFKDLEQDGIINDQDRTIIGKQIPDFMYSLNLSANWRNFNFSCFFQGVEGVDAYIGGYLVSPFYNSAPLLDTWLTDRWTFENPSEQFQRVYVDKTKQKIVSDYYITDASYLRLKNIELGYEFDKKLISKLRLQKLKVSASVQNAFLWSNTKSFDPEKLGDVVSSDFHPQARVYSVGVNVIF